MIHLDLAPFRKWSLNAKGKFFWENLCAQRFAVKIFDVVEILKEVDQVNLSMSAKFSGSIGWIKRAERSWKFSWDSNTERSWNVSWSVTVFKGSAEMDEIGKSSVVWTEICQLKCKHWQQMTTLKVRWKSLVFANQSPNHFSSETAR